MARRNRYPSYSVNTQGGPRFRRQRRSCFGGFFRRFVLPAVVAGVIMGGIMLYNSSFLEISQVTVTGNQRLSASQIAEASGLEGQNILTADINKATDTVRQIQMVRKATLERKLPNEVTISIEERKPYAVWQVKDKRYTIDDEGVVLNLPSPKEGLITIEEVNGEPLTLESQVDARMVPLADRLIQRLPQEIGAKAQRFEYVKNGGLVVVTDKGWRARFGDEHDFDFKLATWKAILDQAAKTKTRVNHVDLRFGTRPFTR